MLPYVLLLNFLLHSSLQLGVKMSAGVEYDSNAKREVGEAPKEDGLLRCFLHVPLKILPSDSSVLKADYSAGGKIFFNEHAEDTLLNWLETDYTHKLSPELKLGVEAEGKHRILKENDRGYLLFTMKGFVSKLWQPWKLKWWIGGRYFNYTPADFYTYREPFSGMRIMLGKWKFIMPFIFYEFGYRSFENPLDAEGLRVWRPASEGGFCTHKGREDVINSGGLGISFKKWFYSEMFYLVEHTKSNCKRWSSLKHRIEVLFSARAMKGMFIQLHTALQFAHYFEGVPFNLDIGDEDERENSITLKITRQLNKKFSLQLSYAFYATEFRKSRDVFLRHTVFFGPSLNF